MAEDIENDRHRLAWSQGHKNLGRSKTVTGNWGKLRKILTDVFVDKAYTLTTYQAITSTEEKTARKNLQGFFLGGPTKDGSRSNNGIGFRSIITLDIDDMIAEQFEDWASRKAGKLWQWEFVAVETRSSTDHAPRFRLVFPLTGKLDHEQYNASSRILASLLFDDEQESMRAVDDVSFRFAQLMFLPTASKGQDLQVIHNEGKILNAHKLLKQWSKKTGYDWADHSFLPYNPDRGNKAPTAPGTTAEDPFEKDGIIGAFCRAYPIEEAMATFLPGVYDEAATPSALPRYTFTQGGGSNGAVVYEDGRFLYSNHGSDPVSEQLVNSWDLVRIHLFADKDKDARANTSQMNLPSSLAMTKLAQADETVRIEQSVALAPKFDDIDFDDDDDEDTPERIKPKDTPKRIKDDPEHINDDYDPEHISSQLDDELEDLLGPEPDSEPDSEMSIEDKFAMFGGDDDDDEPDTEPDKEASEKGAQKSDKESPWAFVKDVVSNDKTNEFEKTRHNAATIICNDPRIKKGIGKNDLTGTPYALKPLDFKKLPTSQALIPKRGRRWTDVDMTALSWCLSAPREPQQGWGTEFNDNQIRLGMLQAAERNSFNPVLDEIRKTEWDGEERIEEFWIKYCGVEDNAYHREAALAFFPAAVMRLLVPGCKFDYVPILEGKQKLGKSGLVEVLAFMEYHTLLSDKFSDTQKMVESIRGGWISEVGELAGFRLADVEDIKKWFSTRSDRIRLAYRENEEDYPRRCVFMGTGNKSEYLRDPTGNRRFWPIRVLKKIDFDGPDGLKANVRQIWAEALVICERMMAEDPSHDFIFDLVSPEAQEIAFELQKGAREEGPADLIREVVEQWVNEPVSEEVALGNSNVFSGHDDDEDGDQYVRSAVSVGLVIKELRDDPIIRDNSRNTKLISEALEYLPGWEKAGAGNVRCKILGHKGSKGGRWYFREGTGQVNFSLVEETGDPEIDDMLG